MTRDEVLKIAAECGNDNGTTLPEDLDFLVTFAEAIAAAQREACAKLCESLGGASSRRHAEAIRARGEE